MRRPLLLLLVALTVLGGGPAHAAEDMTSLTNADRRANGLPGLTTARDLQQFAQRRAEEMARRGELAHTDNLGGKIRDWERLGENVGRGPYLRDIERGFMASETHRHNILFRSFSEVGTGVASDGRLLYVAVVFREPEAEPPTSSKPVSAPFGRPSPSPATFQGFELADRKAAGGGGSSPAGPVAALFSAVAVGGLGLSVAERRRRRSRPTVCPPTGGPGSSPPAAPVSAAPAPAQAPAPARRPASAAPPARPKPVATHKPSARVGQHRSGKHRSKSKRKRR